MKIFRLLILVLLPTILGGCLGRPETDVDPDRIYPTFILTYDEIEERTYTRSIFLADNEFGFRQELQGSAHVDFNGNELRFNNGEDEYLLFFNEIILRGEFEYVDQNGTSYTNPVAIDFTSFPSGLDTVDVRQDLQITWVGNAIAEGEFVTLVIEEQQFGIFESFQVSELGARSLFVPSTELLKFGVGPIILRLNREKSVDTIEDPGLGGQIQSAYLAMPFNTIFK